MLLLYSVTSCSDAFFSERAKRWAFQLMPLMRIICIHCGISRFLLWFLWCFAFLFESRDIEALKSCHKNNKRKTKAEKKIAPLNHMTIQNIQVNVNTCKISLGFETEAPISWTEKISSLNYLAFSVCFVYRTENKISLKSHKVMRNCICKTVFTAHIRLNSILIYWLRQFLFGYFSCLYSTLHVIVNLSRSLETFMLRILFFHFFSFRVRLISTHAVGVFEARKHQTNWII